MIADSLREVPGVLSVHDLHVWAPTSESLSLSARVVVREAAAQRVLEERFHISHVTLQTERADCRATRVDHGLH